MDFYNNSAELQMKEEADCSANSKLWEGEKRFGPFHPSLMTSPLALPLGLSSDQAIWKGYNEVALSDSLNVSWKTIQVVADWPFGKPRNFCGNCLNLGHTLTRHPAVATATTSFLWWSLSQ